MPAKQLSRPWVASTALTSLNMQWGHSLYPSTIAIGGWIKRHPPDLAELASEHGLYGG